MGKLRLGSLFVVLAVSVWALLPRQGDRESDVEIGGSRDIPKAVRAKKKYILKVAPGFYLPGLMPMNVGKPLQGLIKVAEEFEKLYPDTLIEYAGVPGVREWLVTQLSAGQAPDILNVNVEDVWQDVHKGWYIPLDSYLEQPNPFVAPGAPGSKQWWDVFKYQAITRGKAAPDGLMYCITLDMVETGLFYNKDIFRKLSLEPPNDWIEFLDLQAQLKKAGYVPLLVHRGNIGDWGVDLVFDQLYYDLLPGIDLIKDPIREQYLAGYLDWDEICFLYRKGFFTRNDPRYVELWRILKDWRRYFAKDIVTTDRMKAFVTQKGAILWDGSWTVNKLARDPDIEFDWGVFYPPPIPKSYCKYCSGHDMCVIGGSAVQLVITNTAIKDTGDPATSERLKRCVAFLQFLTTPRYTDVVVNETMAFLPNVRGVEPHKELIPFDEILSRRYTTTKWTYTFDLRYNEVLMRMLELYLNDGITLDEHLDWMEKNLEAAVNNIVRRKNLDFNDMERRWIELEPVRRKMEGLPDAAK